MMRVAVMKMVVIIRIHRTAKHGSTTLSNLLLKITASQELNGTQVLQINIILFTEIAPLTLGYVVWLKEILLFHCFTFRL